MSDICFVTWDGGGNVPPARDVARELQRRGHRVRFIGHPTQADRFRDAGLELVPFPSARPFDILHVSSPLSVLSVLADRRLGLDVVRHVRQHPTDHVVVDALLFAVMTELGSAGIPYVALEHSFDGYLRRAAKGPMGWLLRLRRVNALRALDSASRVLVASVRELDAGHGDHVIHTGPVVVGTAAAPTEPTVLISLSTVGFRPLDTTWQRVLDALDGLPARVIGTTGPALDPASLRAPAGVELHAWLPHEEILPQVSLVIGHGGHATTMAALAHGVPVLVLPLDGASDQPFVGRVVQDTGVGRTLSRRSSKRRIRRAVEELLTSEQCRQAAASLGARIRTLDGTRQAADLLESMTGKDPR